MLKGEVGRSCCSIERTVACKDSREGGEVLGVMSICRRLLWLHGWLGFCLVLFPFSLVGLEAWIDRWMGARMYDRT